MNHPATLKVFPQVGTLPDLDRNAAVRMTHGEVLALDKELQRLQELVDDSIARTTQAPAETTVHKSRLEKLRAVVVAYMDSRTCEAAGDFGVCSDACHFCDVVRALAEVSG